MSFWLYELKTDGCEDSINDHENKVDKTISLASSIYHWNESRLHISLVQTSHPINAIVLGMTLLDLFRTPLQISKTSTKALTLKYGDSVGFEHIRLPFRRSWSSHCSSSSVVPSMQLPDSQLRSQWDQSPHSSAYWEQSQQDRNWDSHCSEAHECYRMQL